MLLFPAVIAALEEISLWKNGGNAKTILDSLNAEFLVSVTILDTILLQTKALSCQLQSVKIDLIAATDLIATAQEKLQSFRDNSEQEFDSIFKKANGMLLYTFHL